MKSIPVAPEKTHCQRRFVNRLNVFLFKRDPHRHFVSKSLFGLVTVRISFPTVAGKSYRLERTDDLAGNVWTTVADGVRRHRCDCPGERPACRWAAGPVLSHQSASLKRTAVREATDAYRRRRR